MFSGSPFHYDVFCLPLDLSLAFSFACCQPIRGVYNYALYDLTFYILQQSFELSKTCHTVADTLITSDIHHVDKDENSTDTSTHKTMNADSEDESSIFNLCRCDVTRRDVTACLSVCFVNRTPA